MHCSMRLLPALTTTPRPAVCIGLGACPAARANSKTYCVRGKYSKALKAETAMRKIIIVNAALLTTTFVLVPRCCQTTDVGSDVTSRSSTSCPSYSRHSGGKASLKKSTDIFESRCIPKEALPSMEKKELTRSRRFDCFQRAKNSSISSSRLVTIKASPLQRKDRRRFLPVLSVLVTGVSMQSVPSSPRASSSSITTGIACRLGLCLDVDDMLGGGAGSVTSAWRRSRCSSNICSISAVCSAMSKPMETPTIGRPKSFSSQSCSSRWSVACRGRPFTTRA
mmetsp:Transcript_20596/g.45083  ORF Transcript_20596/g.45083 Transcript_20596/m.45083 type:complete len:280 (+) Transcript_20596:1348-2187(+)